MKRDQRKGEFEERIGEQNSRQFIARIDQFVNNIISILI